MAINWCKLCILPDSRPGLVFDDYGVCNACRSSATKIDIDWRSRERQFDELVKTVKSGAHLYDCLIPVSGGKDSTWQVIKCLEYGLNPLAVTWRPPGRTAVGQANLDNLIRLGVHHIDFSVAPNVEARFMLSALKNYGSSAIPMHMAIFNIPHFIATKFEIPLIVWGENSAFEYGTDDNSLTGVELTNEWLMQHGVMQGTTVDDWHKMGFAPSDLAPYIQVKAKDLKNFTPKGVFLGYFFKWDPKATKELALANGFTSKPVHLKTGVYDFADIDDDFISIHHWLKWYKFGFTRSFDNLSIEIREKRITRSAALSKLRGLGLQKPKADIEKFCDFTNISVAKFEEISNIFRNESIWFRHKGTWQIDNFLIDDWDWNEG